MRLLFIFLVSLFLISSYALQAQFRNNQRNAGVSESGFANTPIDTTKKNQARTNDSIIISYTTLTDSIPRSLDSNILQLHRSPIASPYTADIGNMGAANQSMYYQFNSDPRIALGFATNSHYLISPDSLRYYNTTRPYTGIYYSMGSKLEQYLQLMQTQNILPNWNVTGGYTKLVSPGSFKLLRSNHDHAFLSSRYQSKNNAFVQHVALSYGKIQQDENGGIQSETYLTDPAFNDRRLIPVLFAPSTQLQNRSSVLNYLRRLAFLVQTDYHFKKKNRKSSSTDSSSTLLGIRSKLYGDFTYQFYEDKNPDSAYYGYVYSLDESNEDSLYDKQFLNQVGLSIGLLKPVRLKQQYWSIEAGAGMEYARLTNRSGQSNFGFPFVFAELSPPTRSANRWELRARAKLYVASEAAGNHEMMGTITRKLPGQWGRLQLGYTQTVQSPSYRASYLFSYFNRNTDVIPLAKTAGNKFSIRYEKPNWRADMELTQTTLLNYIYADTSLQIQQYTKALSITQLQANKHLQWKHWHNHNQVILQLAPTNSPVHLPVFLSDHQFFYESKILNQKLHIATGIEIRYASPFQRDRYLPFLNAFAPQYNRTIANLPVWTVFFNFRIKTKFKASISLDELQQTLAGNNINYSFFPAQNRMIRFRLHWGFIN